MCTLSNPIHDAGSSGIVFRKFPELMSSVSVLLATPSERHGCDRQPVPSRSFARVRRDRLQPSSSAATTGDAADEHRRTQRRGQHERGRMVAQAIGGQSMSAECSRRFVLTGADREGRNLTMILWRESDLVDSRVVHRVVLTVDSTAKTVTLLTCAQAIEVAQALMAAAQ